MKGALPMVLLALLTAGVAAYVLLRYFRRRTTPRQARPSPTLPGSTAGEYGATMLEDTVSSEGASDGKAAALPHVASGRARRGASSVEGHKCLTVGAGLRTSVRPGGSAGEGTERLKRSSSTDQEEAELPSASPEHTEDVQDLSAAAEDGESKQEQPVVATREGSSVASSDGAGHSAERASTAVEAEPDRLAKEQRSVEAPSVDEAAGTAASPASGGSETLMEEEQPPTPEMHDEEVVPKVDLARGRRLPQEEDVRVKAARKYKGLARAVPQPRRQESLRESRGRGEVAPRERSLPIEVRLRFLRGGSCSLSLIARRSDGQPEDLPAVVSGSEFTLRAMQDEWYQDVVPPDLSRVLEDGTLWSQESPKGRCTWSLSGRELYVLADRSDMSGYVSQPCLELGRDHVVLCAERSRSRVEEAIRETGAQPASVLDESFGVPPGWIVFRSVVPTESVRPADGADVLNALRPLPRIEISLERGIRVGHQNWINGYPPTIRVYGDPRYASEVRIDGQVAQRFADGAYRTSGWDAVGSHSVWCAGTSRSYSIVPFEGSWERWDAYTFPAAPAASGRTPRLAVCGPLVRAATTEPWGRESFPVPETNRVLLGARPGQIVTAVRVSPQEKLPRIAAPSFRPVWALPRDPLHCDKKTTHILFVVGCDAPGPQARPVRGHGRSTDADVVRWCKVILDASRKGMSTDPNTDAVRAQWLTYKSMARRIWRSHKWV